MRHLYTALAAALMASSAATAQPAQTKGIRLTPTKQALAQAKKSHIFSPIAFGKQATPSRHFSIASTSKAQADEAYTFAPIISEQPVGVLHETFYRSGESFVDMMGYIIQTPFDGVWGKVVEDPDNKTIYFRDPIGAYYSPAWIKGERTTGDTIEVKLPQQFLHEEYDDDYSQDAYLFKLKPIQVTEDGDTYTTFTPDSDQTVKYVWRNDSIVLVNTTADSKIIGMCDETGAWYGYGDYVSRYDQFVKDPVAPDDTIGVSKMALTYAESGQEYGRVKKVVRKGNDVYVAGLNENMPSAWAKGTISGDKITFEGHQFMGIDTLTACYTFFEPIGHNQVWYDYGDGYGDYVDDPTLLDKIEFTYDAESGAFQSDSTFVVNQGYKSVNQMYTYDEPAFEPWAEKAVTPEAVDKEFMSYSPYSEENGFGLLNFAPSEFAADDYVLDTDKLYYSISLDDEVMTFDPEDYPYFTEPTTEIPFSYNDQQYISNYAGMWYIYTFITGMDRIGVQMIYKGGGQVLKSDITYISATGEEDPSAVSNVAASGKVLGTTYTDLSGRRVSRPGKGLFIQTTRMADGTVKNIKRMFK